jgi:hypothetical protein
MGYAVALSMELGLAVGSTVRGPVIWIALGAMIVTGALAVRTSLKRYPTVYTDDSHGHCRLVPNEPYDWQKP